MKQVKLGKLVFFFFLIVIFGGGCKEPHKNNKNIFRYNEVSGISSLDPAFAKNQSIMWAVHQLYSTLVEVDEQLEIKPLLAKEWEFSPEKKSIVFHLRTDVFFHDDAAFPQGRGRKLVAEDVRYSFDRIINPATASP